MQDNGLLNGLNDAQREAVTHGEGPALVLAGPGSGKTTVIVRRILYLIRAGRIPPEQILVVTFTKDAALSMQQRFLDRVEVDHPVVFGTFHSVFYRILLESGYFGGQPVILSPSQKFNIMTEVLRKYAGAEGASCDPEPLKSDARCFLDAVALYKNTRDEASALKRLPGNRRQSFREIFHCYQNRCRQLKALDFDDMVYQCRELLLEDAKKRDDWQRRFRYILIDEFQDSSPLQYEVVKILGERHKNLFVVGDDDQAIYGFRGADPSCLRLFAREFDARQIILNANYRSTEKIVGAAEKVIAVNRDRFPKECYAAGARAGDCAEVDIRSFPDRTQEYEYLVTQLKTLEQGETCGVLFRTNGDMRFLASMLSREGIPFCMKERTGGLREHFVTKDIVAYLKLAGGERDRELFLRIMNRPDRNLDRECLERAGKPAGLGQLERQLAAIRKLSPGLAVQYIIRAVGYGRYLESRREADKHLEEWLDVAEELRESMQGYESVEAWERGMDRIPAVSSPREETGIHLMTVHASKGLEFDIVRMPDCNEKVYPHGNMPDAAAVEEERRIFYVGMTRARKYLELLCTTGTKERPRMMSRFLNPLLMPKKKT